MNGSDALPLSVSASRFTSNNLHGFSESGTRVMRTALQIGEQHGEGHVTLLCLFQALLQDSEGTFARMVESRGKDPRTLSTDVKRTIKRQNRFFFDESSAVVLNKIPGIPISKKCEKLISMARKGGEEIEAKDLLRVLIHRDIIVEFLNHLSFDVEAIQGHVLNFCGEMSLRQLRLIKRTKRIAADLLGRVGPSIQLTVLRPDKEDPLDHPLVALSTSVRPWFAACLKAASQEVPNGLDEERFKWLLDHEPK